MRFHEILFQTNAESFSILTSASNRQRQHFFETDGILKNEKVLFLKKNIFQAIVSKYAKMALASLIFSEGFGIVKK